ncbi:c-type cytochrome domain-containing protein [Sphaerobacter thermophilus]|uniref:c-type cytochrome domain-containing protein n=2 Tax=Sphaerobacter thermophilus TaxID=2057 RepID=UPI000A02A674|nr:c-type cytochrome domain-containing protein [Sphaerobacter thermophilus]
MRVQMWRRLVAGSLLAITLLTAACGGSNEEPAEVPTGEVSFKKHVQPILLRNCVGCHGGSAGLWLDRYETVMEGTPRAPVIIPGDPDASELYLRITGQKQPAMPIGGRKLRPEQIETIRLWIAQGAKDN